MNEEDIIAMCTDCLSVLPDSKAEKDPFLQAGLTGVCPYCGGPVIVTDKSQIERIRRIRQFGSGTV